MSNYPSVNFENVHATVMNQWHLSTEDYSKDVEIAKQLEAVLQYLKNPNIKAVGNRIQDIFDKKCLDWVRENVSLTLGLGPKGLFRTTSLEGQQYLSNLKQAADDIVEAEIAGVLAGLQEYSKTQGQVNLNQKDFKTFLRGTIQGTISTPGAFIDINAISEAATQQLVEKIQKRIEEESLPSIFANKVEVRAVKTDVSSYDLQLSSSPNAQMQNLINLFAGKNFSVKNYATSSSKIKIGSADANPLKAFYGTLLSSYDLDYTQKIIYSGLNRLPDDEIEKHFVHLKTIYELTGANSYNIVKNSDGSVSLGELQAVDFLIVNVPTSRNIWVHSTKALISDYIANENTGFYGSLTGKISVKKSTIRKK